MDSWSGRQRCRWYHKRPSLEGQPTVRPPWYRGRADRRGAEGSPEITNSTYTLTTYVS